MIRFILLTILISFQVNALAAEIGFLSTTDKDWKHNYESAPSDDCINLTGTIKKGDLIGIRRLFSQAGTQKKHTNVLCLDSPGGSFTEAIEIAKYLREKAITTRLLQNTTCESACALIFLGGTLDYFESSSYGLSRYMHITAKLGFHAPSLVVAHGNYNEEAVNKAYKIAINSLSEGVTALMVPFGERPTALPASLLAKMLNTPSDQMFYITTIDQVGRWKIGLVGAKFDAPVSNIHLHHGCNNMLQWNLGESAINVKYRNFQNENHPNKFWVLFNEMEGTGCEFYEPSSKKLSDLFEVKFNVEKKLIEYATSLDKTLLFLDPNTKFLQLGNAATIPQENTTPKTTGRCTITAGNQFFDNDPCTKVVENKKVSGVLSAVFTYIWPSGAKTIIVNRRGRISINGLRSKLTRDPTAKTGECAFNPKKKKLFCYTAQ